ncbi:co-chaperone GroES [Patescibacteria group bacterium]|nr:co-chaperone GroES [Patescibacteria group bacterium]
MAKIIPVSDNLVVEALEAEKTASGIIIPDTASKEKPQKGKVIAAGPGKVGDDNERIPMEVKEGDTILFKFQEWGATKVKVDGKELLVLKADDVLGIFQD